MLTCSALACLMLAGPATNAGRIETVLGPIEPSELGPTLTHEHILVDFVGAEQVSRERYDADEVFRVMLPYLEDLREAGIRTLVECTPDYLGRDPLLLRRLSEASGIHILTNTGLYKDPFLPRWAHEATAEQLAERWTREAREGIEGTGIRPGFIKIAVEPDGLSEMQRKIVRAAALTSLATGLPIASHTGTGKSALEELDILAEAGCPAERLIVVHLDGEPDLGLHEQIAARGAWLSYDGIREGNAAERARLLATGLARWPEQLLISQDAGWYHVGEAGGGEVAPWSWLPRALPELLSTGGAAVEESTGRLLTRSPARAFTIAEPRP